MSTQQNAGMDRKMNVASKGIAVLVITVDATLAMIGTAAFNIDIQDRI